MDISLETVLHVLSVIAMFVVVIKYRKLFQHALYGEHFFHITVPVFIGLLLFNIVLYVSSTWVLFSMGGAFVLCVILAFRAAHYYKELLLSVERLKSSVHDDQMGALRDPESRTTQE